MAQAAAMTLGPGAGANSADGPRADGSLRSAMSDGSLRLRVTDVSGQKSARASAVPLSSTIRELVQEFLAKMGLARIDADGRPLQYYARLEREGRHLNGSELVGDALENDDELTLTPNIEAGGR